MIRRGSETLPPKPGKRYCTRRVRNGWTRFHCTECDRQAVAAEEPPEVLLHHPPTKSANPDDVEEVDRPQTCPIPTLTPQFHWNLNNSALNTLTRSQIEKLHALFKFYDSSTVGDALPSINCARLQEIFRDAQLLSDEITNSVMPSEKRLQVEAVERIFAQAVMGKMRVYLDEDDQPALTFPLFCGALMNCAMLLAPLARPTTALEQILPMLLEIDVPASKGLLGHSIRNDWAPEESQVLQPQTEDAQEDFRKQPAIQQVIADCTRDKLLEKFKQDKRKELYEIPDRLVESFYPDTLELILNKFRMFDVNDCGMVPRQEIFALLSCFGTHQDLPDPYAILAKLPALNSLTVQRPGNNGGVSGDELTLVQLLQLIEMAREEKRHSAASNLAAIKIRVDRVAVSVRGTIAAVASNQESTADNNGNNDRTVNSRKSLGNNTGGNNGRGRRNGVVAIPVKPRRSMLSSKPEANASSKSLLGTKHQSGHKAHPVNHSSVPNRRKTVARGRKATISSDQNGPQDNTNLESARESHHSGTTARSNAGRDSAIMVLNSDNMMQPSNNQASADSDNEGVQLQYVPGVISVQVNGPSSAKRTTLIRTFLLLGGEHDGAIYCTLSLVCATRKIEESEGIFYSTASNETTRTTPVLPTQHTLTNALLMLKKCVVAKLEQGFELHPADQLGIVDKLLHNQRDRQPHFGSPVLKTSRNLKITAVVNSPSPGPPTRFIRSAASDRRPRRQKFLPPHSKPSHRRLELPTNYQQLFATWGLSQHGNYSWIHDLNAASPLKPAMSTSASIRSGLLSPLHVPLCRHGS